MAIFKDVLSMDSGFASELNSFQSCDYSVGFGVLI